MIIAVGFKINNERAIQFIKWANTIVKDYTIKGWVIERVNVNFMQLFKTKCIMQFMVILQLNIF